MRPPRTPPNFARCGTIYVDEHRLGGYWGASPTRGCLAYTTARDSEAHRLRELSAYAISVSILAKLDRIGVERVFVVETDTNVIYEYTMAQFLEDGEPVPDDYLEDLLDPQRFAGTEVAAGRWEGIKSDFYLPVPMDEDVALTVPESEQYAHPGPRRN